MNRRGFLKFLGIGATAAIPIPARAMVKTLDMQISEHVIYPEVIVANPSIIKAFNLNDHITGMAAIFTNDLCNEWLKTEKNRTVKNLEALAIYSTTQNSYIGLYMARSVCRIIIEQLPGEEKKEAINSAGFQKMIEHWRDFLFSAAMQEHSAYLEKLKRQTWRYS